MSERLGKIIRIFGVVQGVGYRPFVSRLANRLHLSGSVINKGSFVEIQIGGTREDLAAFQEALVRDAPERAAIQRVDAADCPCPEGEFSIDTSEDASGDIFISPDLAICGDCRKELLDPENRRYLHPFINCTACGPRLTILDAMPYDRERTSMREFAMCPECEREYHDPASRRYDAQPICCHNCGPELYLLRSGARGTEAIRQARKMIMQGEILAVKGIGGYHLACDARNVYAVKRLRELKRRPSKPFGLMMRDLGTVQKTCAVSAEQLEMLIGPLKPIVLLAKKAGCGWTDLVAPGNPMLGVMLPYTPLHVLLFEFPDEFRMTDVLVMTSGNSAGVPICCDETAAEREIGRFCDDVLSFNREIRLRADDSVVDFFEAKPYMIRRSRGFAPLPIRVSGCTPGHAVLGLGGDLKNCFCLGKGALFYPSAYIGDLADIRSVEVLKNSIQRMERLLHCVPEIVACDCHPEYHATEVAETLDLPVLKVQHHYAHVLSCMAENNVQEEVLGIAFDGTGYGTDGTIWGGEILRVNYHGFERLSHIDPFVQMGGDLTIHEGWRTAAVMLGNWFPEEASAWGNQLKLADAHEMQMLERLAKQPGCGIVSTSAGRLFDAMAALLGICSESTFEGEAAIRLQQAAERWRKKDFHEEANSNCTAACGDVLPAKALVYELLMQKLANADVEKLSYDFHCALAVMIVENCLRQRERTNLNSCAVSGGVFQNRLLLELVVQRLRQHQFQVYCHSMVPANDGGLAFGQAVAAMHELGKR